MNSRIFPRQRLFVSLLVLLVAAGGLLAGCVKEYDFERDVPERGTLGEELHRIWVKDAERAAENAESKTQMLEQRETEFVTSVDTIAPGAMLHDIDLFFRELLDLVDEGVLPGMTRKITVMLRDAASNDALIKALAANKRPDPDTYISPANGKSFLGHLLSYSRIQDVGTGLSTTLLENDGYNDDGSANTSESTPFSDTLIALSEVLEDVEAGDPKDSFAYSLQDIMLVEDPRFEPADVGGPLHAVRYDHRGYPMAVMEGSEPRFPFVDENDDGLADIDEDGNFVLSTGSNLQLKPFETDPETNQLLNRDEFGRGFANEGEYSFEYIDLNRTGLNFLVRQLGFLSARGFLWDLTEFAPTAFGDLVAKQDDRGAFFGYSTDNPLIDAFYGLVHVLDIPELHEAMSALAGFMDMHSPALAGVVFSFDELSAIIDGHPNAEMTDDNTLLYDLMPVLEEIAADPDLWADFMNALSDPITRKLGESMIDLHKYKDVNSMAPALDGPYDQCFQGCKGSYEIGTIERYECIRACPKDGMFSTLKDRSAPESVDNRSLHARLLHLLRDTQGQPYGLQITEPGWLAGVPPIISLDGSAEAFIRSVAGNLDLEDHVPDEFWNSGIGGLLDLIGVNSGNLADLLSTLSPIFGARLDRQATPDQITRLFNQPELSGSLFGIDLAIEPPVCKDGYVMANHHADLLFASEATGLIDTLHPLAKAFSDHNREDLLARFFVAVHKHYSSRDDLYQDVDGNDSPMAGSNLRSYEPVLIELYEDGKLFDALADLSIAAQEFKSAGGEDLVEMLRKIVYNGFRSDDGFVMRDGTDMMNLPDGRTVRDLSRMHVLADAIDRLAERVDADPNASERFESAVSTLFEVFLEASWPDGQRPYFENQGTVALSVLTMRHLSARALELRQQGRLSEWLTDDQVAAVVDLFDSRTLPAVVELQSEIFGTSEDRELTEDLITYLVSGPDGRRQATLAAYVTMVYSLQTDIWIPLAKFLADKIDPEKDWGVEPMGNLPLGSHGVLMLNRTVEIDEGGVGLDMFERSFAFQSDQTIPIFVIFDVIADYFRSDPAAGGAYSEEDYRRVFNGFADWMDDDVHGMEQLYDIIETRTASE
jgi:hypothetical protein